MANEATVVSSLRVRGGNVNYSSLPASFRADMLSPRGPTPGLVSVSVTGTDVSFAPLDHPGLCRISNQDTANRIEVGVYEPATGTYYPLLEILPGESYIVRLSRSLNEEYSGTVTGTGTVAENNSLRLKAYGAACYALVEAFEA